MPTFSVDSNIRKKIFDVSLEPITPQYLEPASSVPTLTNASIKEINNKLATKPMLITRTELQNLGKDIKLVGYDPLDGLISSSNKTFSSKLLNWVEPYEIKGSLKTLFYTEVNSELKVGDRVFIINGNYDSDALIEKNKYKKGRDGYKILSIDNCKVVLDIDYTGVKPYTTSNDDDFIKIFYIRDNSEFLHANRAITTRGGKFEYKFDYYQNNIAFIDSNYTTTQNWGYNTGVVSTPGFFVRSSTASWTNISSPLINSGSYSLALSPSYSNINRIKIMNSDFTYNGKEFKEGYIYKWYVGPTQSEWVVDSEYFAPYLTKNNFRDGNFRGVWNSGLYGQYKKRIKWHGDESTWNLGTLLNTIWKKGKMNSLYTSIQSYFSSFDEYGLPYQKINSPNNAGRGYNFIWNSKIEQSEISNGSFYRASFGYNSATFSVVENEILSYDSPFINKIQNSYFNDCEFNNSYLENSELKNTKSNNSKFEKAKSINSYFNNSVLKNSNYNSDNIIKVYAYDELTASEIKTPGYTYSSTNDIDQKVFKFYIDKNGYERLRSGDVFYIKGLKINNLSKDVINFFDKKFKIGTWTEYIDSITGTSPTNYWTKKPYEYSAFLSTPADNTYKFNSTIGTFPAGPKRYTEVSSTNPNNKYYSLDIWVSRFDIYSNPTTDNVDFDYNSSTFTYLNNSIIDISNAYIVDSDFDSGLIENSDWNSGSHIEPNNDTNITISGSSGGQYNLSIDSSLYLTATSSYSSTWFDSKIIDVGSIVFLDSVDFTYGLTTSRLPDTYKVISNTNGVYKLKEIGTYSSIISLSASNGYFQTKNAQNRYGYIKKLKISKSNIKSGLLRRSYLFGSLIQNLDYDYNDKDFSNLEKVRNLIISDSIFSNNQNILSNATYLNSFFLSGSDVWNSGIVQNSIWNGPTFSNGVVRDTRWIDGNFLSGTFYNSRTFDGTSSALVTNYKSENINSYYKSGYPLPNNRNSWQSGNFYNGEFLKSDWEFGTFLNGRFYYSKWYDGTVLNGLIGSNQLSSTDTIFYNGTVSYATVENASLFASDTSYLGNVNQNIYWLDGIFINGIFGSSILQSATNSATWYNGLFNGGQFITNAKWKNGTFNGGKFLSAYGWSQSESLSQSDYGWESGIFNGGEFGNANGLTNSTWYTGSFNDGIFKGRVWNNGIFLYGEFQGSGRFSPVSGVKSLNAQRFINSYTYSYWGKWRSGILTNTKDKFIKNEKFFTNIVKARLLEKVSTAPKKAIFKNALWLSGTFSHPSGEMNGSVWLDGAFERGKFINSSFNPYVDRSLVSSSTPAFSNQLLYNSGFDLDGDPFTSGTQILGWATASSSLGGKYSTFSAGVNSTALYVGEPSSAGLYLYNMSTNLSSGYYQFDMNIITHSSTINLKVNVGTYSYFNSSSPFTLGLNTFRSQVNGGSVSLYVDTSGIGGSISIGSLEIKKISPSFNFNDDTCYWENGDLIQSDFYISQWKNGNFIIGTGIGLVWKNGISSYMNAFNVFWENGLWRNGNWYGSSFDFNGSVTDDYTLQILYRGMSWSGTSSCHFWNIFKDTADEVKLLSVSAANIGTLGWSSDSTGILTAYSGGAPSA